MSSVRIKLQTAALSGSLSGCSPLYFEGARVDSVFRLISLVLFEARVEIVIEVHPARVGLPVLKARGGTDAHQPLVKGIFLIRTVNGDFHTVGIEHGQDIQAPVLKKIFHGQGIHFVPDSTPEQ